MCAYKSSVYTTPCVLRSERRRRAEKENVLSEGLVPSSEDTEKMKELVALCVCVCVCGQ